MKARVPGALGAITGALLLGTLAALVLLARDAVKQAAHDVLLAETQVVAALHGETETLDGLPPALRRRMRVTGPSARELDRPALVDGDGVTAAQVSLYGPDRWTVTGTLTLEPPSGLSPPLPAGVRSVVGVAGLLLLVLAWWWPSAAARGRPGTLAGAAAAALLLAAPAVLAHGWARAHLAELTDLRLAVGAAGLRQLPDELARAVLDRPGGVTRLTGLAFVDARGGADPPASTLLPATARALAALTPSVPARTRVDGAPWALTEARGVVLARTPYEHTLDPGPRQLGMGLAGFLLALLPLSLAPIAGRRRELRRNLVAWAFLGPAGVHLAIFTLGPLAFALWLSFHEWTLVDPARPFVGLANYAALLGDGEFWNAMGNTAVFTLHVPVAMAIALGFALLTHGRARGVTLVRAALFLPSITSLVAIAVVWQWMLNDQYGLFNWVLAELGLEPVPWLTSPRTALLAIMLLSTWLVVGYQMILFQAGLAAIPRELYEAARIDGAGAWHRFRHVTLPGLRHTLFFVLVTSLIGSFQVFGAVYVMTEGGPLGSTDVAVYHIYREAWEFLRFGNAAAMSWILFAVIFAVTWLHFRLLERRVQEGEA